MQKLVRCILIATAAAAAWAGCADQPASSAATNASKSGNSPTNVSSNSAAAIPGWPPTKAQPKLPTRKLFLGKEVIAAELALTPVQMGTGMMFRTSMAEEDGMLFVFPRPHRAAFYMKNTLVPLTAAYIDPEGTILELHDLQPKEETPVDATSDNIQFVLEMNQGWFKRHNISTGAVVSTEAGSLRKMFGLGQ